MPIPLWAFQTHPPPPRHTIVTCTVFYRALTKPSFSGRRLVALPNQAPSQRGSFWASMYASRNAQSGQGEDSTRTCAGKGPAGRGAEGTRRAPSPFRSRGGREGEHSYLLVRSRRLFAHFLLTTIRQAHGAAPTQPGRSQNSPETSPLLPPPVCRPRPGHGPCGE